MLDTAAGRMLDTAAAQQDTAAAARRGSARSGAHATVRRIGFAKRPCWQHVVHSFLRQICLCQPVGLLRWDVCGHAGGVTPQQQQQQG